MSKDAQAKPDSVLDDPAVYPTDEVLLLHLGRAKSCFDAMLEHSRSRCAGLAATWKYYQDGKSWLLNLSLRKKTVCWVLVGHASFRTTFYLGAAVEARILASAIPTPSKDQYRASAGKKIRGVSVVIRTKKDLVAFRELLDIRLSKT